MGDPSRFRGFSIEIDGKAEYSRLFARADAIFSDFSSVWPDVRKTFFQIEKAQFDNEGNGSTGRWAQLSMRYKAQKLRRYGSGRKILEASGDLRRSLTSPAIGSVFETTKTELTIGTSFARGNYHQRGGGRLPQRKIIDFNEDQKQQISKTVQKGLIRELRKGGNYFTGD